MLKVKYKKYIPLALLLPKNIYHLLVLVYRLLGQDLRKTLGGVCDED